MVIVDVNETRAPWLVRILERDISRRKRSKIKDNKVKLKKERNLNKLLLVFEATYVRP